jgi:hypothetical protein
MDNELARIWKEKDHVLFQVTTSAMNRIKTFHGN